MSQVYQCDQCKGIVGEFSEIKVTIEKGLDYDFCSWQCVEEFSRYMQEAKKQTKEEISSLNDLFRSFQENVSKMVKSKNE